MKSAERIEIADKDMELFRRGLKLIVSERFSTQVEFAHKVGIAKVSMNKVFTGKTARPRQETIAKILKTLGMTAEEIIERGQPETNEDDDERLGVPNFAGMKAGEIISEVSLAVGRVSDYVMALVEDRNRSWEHLQKKQRILNALGEQVKAVDKNMIVTYGNKAHRAAGGAEVGETCRDAECSGHSCPAIEVFATGKPVMEIIRRGNRWLGVNVYPMWGSNGDIVEVVISARDVTHFHELALRGAVK